METFLRQNFPVLPNGEVIIYQDTKGFYGYDPAKATQDFGSLPAKFTHADLMAHPLAQQGWAKFFDAWKAQGLIL